MTEVRHRTPHPATEATWFGHPRGLTFLFGSEMWERFSYYGMRLLLPIYCLQYLLLPGHHEQVIGFETVRGWLAAVYGAAQRPAILVGDLWHLYRPWSMPRRCWAAGWPTAGSGGATPW